MNLIPDWKEAYRWFSVQGATVLTVLSLVYAYVGAFQAILPPWAFGILTAIIGLAIILGRLIQQGVIKVKDPGPLR